MGAGTSEDSPVGYSNTLLMVCVPVPGVLRCSIPAFGYSISEAGLFWMNGQAGETSNMRYVWVMATFDEGGRHAGYGSDPIDFELRCFDYGADAECDQFILRSVVETDSGTVGAHGYAIPYYGYEHYYVDILTPESEVSEERRTRVVLVCRDVQGDCDSMFLTVASGDPSAWDTRVVQVIRYPDGSTSACVYDNAAAPLNAETCNPPF